MDDLRLDLRQALRSFVKNPAFSASWSSPWPSASAPTPRSSRSWTRCCCGSCPCTSPSGWCVLHGPGPFSGYVQQPLEHVHADVAPDVRAPVATATPCSRACWPSTGRPSTSARADRPTTWTATSSPARSSRRSASRPPPAVCSRARTTACPADIRWSCSATASGRAASPPTRAVVGSSVRINDHPMTVIGVAQPRVPRHRGRASSVDVYVPLAMQPQVLPTWPKGPRRLARRAGSP